MPKGRMLNKKISHDEIVAKLSPFANIIYTWCIPHLDCEGRIYADAITLKGSIVPYLDYMTILEIEKCVKELGESGLVLVYGNDHKYMQFNGFEKNQKIDKDREAASIIPTPESLESGSRETLAKVKESKVKESKVFLDLEAPINYLNEKAKRNYDSKNSANRELIKARYNEGRTLEQIKLVIDKKVLEWLTDEKMAKYLRPSTLFSRTNFENYLNEPIVKLKVSAEGQGKSVSQMAKPNCPKCKGKGWMYDENNIYRGRCSCTM